MKITKRVGAELQSDGTLRGGRKAYYKAYSSEGRPLMCGRATAADLSPETAEIVLKQLNQLHGGGFELTN